MFIILFRFIIMLCGTDIILQNIPHIQSKCGEYFIKFWSPFYDFQASGDKFRFLDN